uniref:Uncharacterized protein n=1 Tax=Caenorhabditis tropicalis TaxID=1561998 RepID=A0A1I7SYF8_9PELO
MRNKPKNYRHTGLMSFLFVIFSKILPFSTSFFGFFILSIDSKKRSLASYDVGNATREGRLIEDAIAVDVKL